MSLNIKFEDKERTYTGVELRPHFLLTKLGLRGTALGVFIGPCNVKTDHLVDWEDRLAGDHIAAKQMIHLIGEFFGVSLREGVLFQRLLVATAAEILKPRLAASAFVISRSGDDLFIETEPGKPRKLTVSIVTASTVSQLLHLGINIDPTGAPVPAIGLAELGVTPESFVPLLLKKARDEWDDIEWACTKVRPVIES